MSPTILYDLTAVTSTRLNTINSIYIIKRHNEAFTKKEKNKDLTEESFRRINHVFY